MESHMHIDDNQLENKKVTLNVCIISNYTEQVEDTADFNILNPERAKEYSCPDTANNSISHITTPPKKKKVESPMHIDNNQLGTKKSSEVAGMMMNYNVPAQKSADTEQVEETDNSSKANTAALNILSPVLQMKKLDIKSLVVSDNGSVILINLKELEEENQMLTEK